MFAIGFFDSGAFIKNSKAIKAKKSPPAKLTNRLTISHDFAAMLCVLVGMDRLLELR